MKTLEKFTVNNGYEDIEVKVGDEVKFKKPEMDDIDGDYVPDETVTSHQYGVYEQTETGNVEVSMEVEREDEDNYYGHIISIYEFEHEQSSEDE